jgi:membrane protein implicated in regulation of membrane protease activity
MPSWLVWLIVAGLFAAAETLSTAFVLLMMAGGAAGGAVAAGLGAPLGAQVAVFVVVSALLAWLVRPVMIRHLHPATTRTGSDALVGREAVVLADVNRDGGRVRLNGGEWSARAVDPLQKLPAGARVLVVAIEGATAVVSADPLG